MRLSARSRCATSATFALIALAHTASPALTQERTLLDGGFRSGGFGGPVIKFTGLAGDFATLVGGRGGWIINSTFVLGVGGYGLVNDVRPDREGFGGGDKLGFGYWGGELEYVGLSDELVHFSVFLLIGGGNASFQEPGESDIDDSVFILEPAANLELNITSYFRINGGFGWRFVSGVDLLQLENSDLRAAVGTLTFKFGAF